MGHAMICHITVLRCPFCEWRTPVCSTHTPDTLIEEECEKHLGEHVEEMMTL